MTAPKRKAPYEDTKVPVETRTTQIEKLLTDYGAEEITWQKNFRFNQVKLGFRYTADIKGKQTGIGIMIEPGTFGKERKTWNAEKGSYDMVFSPNWPQSFALLYYWLKAKLEGISYGMNSVEKEFMSNIMVGLPSGRSTTVGEYVLETIANGRLALEARSDDVPSQQPRIISTVEEKQ